MTEPKSEFCVECREPTGRSADDDLICRECGTGPYCDECFATHRGEHFAEAKSAPDKQSKLPLGRAGNRLVFPDVTAD
jgi:hypothetical protein